MINAMRIIIHLYKKYTKEKLFLIYDTFLLDE